jgi:hypothetical protein
MLGAIVKRRASLNASLLANGLHHNRVACALVLIVKCRLISRVPAVYNLVSAYCTTSLTVCSHHLPLVRALGNPLINYGDSQ